MELSKQVCSLKGAKRLKELGMSQDSLFMWVGGFEYSEVDPSIEPRDQSNLDISINGYYGDPKNIFAAFTVAELGYAIGNYIDKIQTTLGNAFKIVFEHPTVDKREKNYGTGTTLFRIDNIRTEAEAREFLAIYLLENGFLKYSQ